MSEQPEIDGSITIKENGVTVTLSQPGVTVTVEFTYDVPAEESWFLVENAPMMVKAIMDRAAAEPAETLAKLLADLARKDQN